MTALPVWATSLLERPLSDLSREAHGIYRVEVLSKSYVKTGGSPWTEFEVQVLEVFKGDTPSSSKVKLHLPGGEMDGKSTKISGLPEIQVSHEYVVFVQERLGQGVLNRLVDWSAYVVGRNQYNERFIVSTGSHRRQDVRRSALMASEARQVWSYDGFVEDIYFHMDN